MSDRLPRPTPDRKEGIAPNGLPFESVWDYPRPPKVEPETRPVLIEAIGITIASSERALRVCETSGAPVVYLPVEDLTPEVLRPNSDGRSLCEWKGPASYLDIVVGETVIPKVAWTYRRPWMGFEQLVDHYAFYPALVECHLADELVRPQPGGFYGGWVTDEITGPIKGFPGSEGW